MEKGMDLEKNIHLLSLKMKATFIDTKLPVY